MTSLANDTCVAPRERALDAAPVTRSVDAGRFSLPALGVAPAPTLALELTDEAEAEADAELVLVLVLVLADDA